MKLMSSLKIVLICLAASLTYSAPSFAETTSVVVTGVKTDLDLQAKNRELEARIRMLERQVSRLQDDVSELLKRDFKRTHLTIEHRQKGKSFEFACMLQTSMHGTFVARSKTKVEAMAGVLQKCDVARAPFCEKDKVNCERSAAD